jgi:hypothetical protein
MVKERFERSSNPMPNDSKTQNEWYQKAIRALEFAISDNTNNRDQDEDPPTEESITAASGFLNESSEKLATIAPPKISISANGTIHLRWKVSDGRIDVSFRGSTMEAFISTRAEQKALEKSEITGRVLALLA